MLKLGSWSSVQIHSIILFYHTVSHTHLAASYFQPIRSPLFRTKVSLGVFHPIETSGANQSQSFVCEGDRNDRTKLKSKRNSKTRTIIFKTRTMKRAKNVKFFSRFYFSCGKNPRQSVTEETFQNLSFWKNHLFLPALYRSSKTCFTWALHFLLPAAS